MGLARLHKIKIGYAVLIGLPLFFSASCAREDLLPLQQLELATSQKYVSLHVTNACFTAPQTFADFYLLMRSVKFRGATALSIYSRDGIPDVDKVQMGMPIFTNDASNTGYGNLLVYLLGIPASSFGSIPKCTDPTKASVPGFLTDCQRDVLQLDQVVESAPRGIPDDIAIWFGLSLTDVQVGTQNPAGDGITNIQKIKLNAPIGETLDDQLKSLLPIYNIKKTNKTQSTCYDFTVSHILVMDVTNGNLIVPYFLFTNATGDVSAKAPPIVFPRSVADGSVLEYDYAQF